MPAKPSFAVLLLALERVHAIDNGKGVTPPMGWRSWNLYGANVNQQLIEKIMDGMVTKSRMVDGVPTSLCDLGYCDVGLDDNWQTCTKSNKYNFHTDAGSPVVNTDRFPNMAAMTAHAHTLGLTAGMYYNNCICSDNKCGNGNWTGPDTDPKCYVGDVDALVYFGFDSVKLDGCSNQRDLNLWAKLFNESGRSIMIENCHWGRTLPTLDWCPWNFYRTSGDVRARYASVVANLQTTVPLAAKGLSRPGCWAYPDMLEVGCEHGPGGTGDPGLSKAETRSHFGAWAIVSSPLTLSHDVTNDTVTDSIWDVISNKEVIAVNQAWAGHSGSPFAQSEQTVTLSWEDVQTSAHRRPTKEEWKLRTTRTHTSPTWQAFYKPMLPGGAADAVLLMNHAGTAQDLSFNFADVPSVTCSKCHVRDIWAKKDLGTFTGSFTASAVGSHDSAFLKITPATTATSAA